MPLTNSKIFCHIFGDAALSSFGSQVIYMSNSCLTEISCMPGITSEKITLLLQ